jgi:hypothetical protein
MTDKVREKEEEREEMGIVEFISAHGQSNEADEDQALLS